jgi:RNA recognition motif-containing protein
MKLFVAGLPYDMDDAELTEFFDKFGTVTSAKVTMDKETGKSRGFAFVEMPNEAEAREAIEGLNNLGIGKKVMIVKPAEERREGSAYPSDGRPRFDGPARSPRSRY